MKSFCLAVCLLSFSTALWSQQPSPADNDFVQREFGSSCSLAAPWIPVTGDLNGDGVEDIVIVAHCKNPLIDQGEKDFKVIDPYNSFYGYGNPKITSQMGPDDPKLRGIDVLVIHGSGPDAWPSTTPPAKFGIINIAVKRVTGNKMRVK